MEAPPKATKTLECKETFDQETLKATWDAETAPANIPAYSTRQIAFNTELTTQDVKAINELGRLNAMQLHEYITNLQNSAYLIGIDEARQCSKGKFLQVFKKS
ncbi:unnamed protein product, partial [Mesorhabditis belari]|uniref:Uncharacterized protein n=1 Tax=Mesorhabditis belari TaxID=2138241 RepID=A0AAF3FA55_9BILA